MSNLRNRFLALAIVVMMLVAALSSTASAATTKFVDVDDPDDAKMISLLSAIGIVKGAYADEDGSMVFDSETPVSRQQMALFLARINSANPGAFEPDDSIKLTFTDVKDSTYFLAIKHCYEQGIIEGRDAETFDPLNTVKLDEALAMIVRALGFKDLSYPIETTKKAKELGFALKYADTAGKNELTRIEVMRLLYTYFYSDEQSLEIVKNEITGVQHTVRVPHPVMEKFGISVNDAYIVRSNDYTAGLANATLETPNGDILTLPAVTVPNLTTSDINAGRTVILAYNNYKVVSTSNADTAYLTTDSTKYTRINGYTYSGKWSYIAVRPEDIDGLEKDYSDRWAVGLKVVYYQDTLAATRAEALGVLSYVKGTKVSLEDVDSKEYPTTTNMRDDLSVFSDYSKGITLFGNEYDLRQNAAQESALTNADIYQFANGDTKLIAGTVTTSDKISVISDLAKFIKMNGQFGLEYVVNDTDENGVATEFYYVFTPYSAGYYLEDKRPDDSDDNKDIAYRRFVTGMGKTEEVSGNTSWYYQNPDPSKNIVLTYQNKDVSSIEKGNAYLYTREGVHLNIFAKLVKRVDSKYPDYIYSGSMSLNGNVITVSDKNAKIAIGATTSTGNFGVGAKHSAFSLTSTSDIFFVVRIDDIPGASDNRKYGVLTAAPTSVANYQGNGQYMYLYSVFTYADNRTMSMTSEILLSDYNYWETRKLEAGDLVSYQKVGDYYRVGAFDDNSYLYMSGNGYANYITSDPAAGWTSRTSTTSVMRKFAWDGQAEVYYTPSASNLLTITDEDGGSLTGIINSDTEILLTQYSESGRFIPDNFVTGRKLTKAEFDSFMTDMEYEHYTIEMITAYQATISNALVVHVRANYNATYNNDMYATVYELLGSDNAYYSSVTTMAKAYNYLNGVEYLVAAASGAALKVGEVVRISPDRYSTVNGTTYWLVSRISTPAAQDAVSKIIEDEANANRGNFTQPYNLMNTIKDWRGTTLNALAASLTSSDNNVWAYPIVTSTRGGAIYGGTSTSGDPYINNGSAIILYTRTAINTSTSTKVTFYATGAATTLQPAVTTGQTANITGYSNLIWDTDLVELLNIDADATLTAAKKTIVDQYKATTYLAVPSVTGTYTTGGSVAMYTPDIGNNSSSTVYSSISLLNRNKVNYITITLSSTSTLSFADANISYSRKAYDEIPVITNGSNNSTIGSSDLRKYYVITNNTTSTQTSDVVTIIEFVAP